MLSSSKPVLGQVRLVKDINTSGVQENSKGYALHESGPSRSFFVASQSELWTSDGTATGTIILRRFQDIKELKVIGGIAYFTVLTEAFGYELWRSDGTSAGTILLKDIYPGSGSSSPSSLVNVNGVLYFSANNSINGRELWKSNGTTAGTVMVKDIILGGSGSSPTNLTAVNSKVFFSANGGATGYELYSSDGTAGGTVLVKDINPGGSSSPGGLINANGVLLFHAALPPYDRQLWRSNGTSAGTQLVKVINAGGQSAKINRLTNVNGVIFFEATDGIHGLELWKSNGTTAGTVLVKDITPGPGSATAYATEHLNHFAAVNGKLFFAAVAEQDNIDFVWISDGTTAGTHPVASATDVALTWIEPGFTDINGSAFFFGQDRNAGFGIGLYKCDGINTSLVRANVGYELEGTPDFRKIGTLFYFFGRDYFWRTNGTTAGTFPVRLIGFPAGSNPATLTDLGGTLYFIVDGLWKSNGTAATTAKVVDISTVNSMTGYNTKLYLEAYADGVGYVPWVSNGTPAGTFVLNSTARYPRFFTGSGGLMFFDAQNTTYGEELWVSDGTVVGTKMVKDINPGGGNSTPRELTNVNNTLFFSAYDPATGAELWKSNGTSIGTVLVKDIAPGLNSSNIEKAISFQGKVFFQANDDSHGRELWSSNGTAAGTVMVKDLRINDLTDNDLGGMKATSTNLFFSALNDVGKVSLWKSNGTGAGTVKLIDFQTTDFVQMLGASPSQVFFLVRFATYSEFWRSDGTVAGTRKLKTLNNQYLGYPGIVAVRNNVIYFGTTYLPSNYVTLWRSDGTYSGTYAIPFNGSNPAYFTTSGPYVYFTGNSHQYGNELFVIEESTSATEVSEAVVVEQDSEIISTYPNPFNSSLSLRVRGDENELFQLNVTNLNGQSVNDATALPCNVDHNIGSSWRPGMYVLHIRQKDKVTTKKIIKVN
jgi:ELWxxDGT repeat protein